MRNSGLHRLASRIVGLLKRVLPQSHAEWVCAIETELWEIESGWEALRWALSALKLAFTPANVFGKEGLMRRLRPSIPAVAALVAMTQLLSPGFREAFSVSLINPWTSYGSQQHIEKIAVEARSKADAELLAWSALRCNDLGKSVALADEAVAINPELTWIYYPVCMPQSAIRNNQSPCSGTRVERLMSWDPENAVPHLAAARLASKSGQSLTSDAVAVAETTRALESSKYDGYFTQRFELERRTARQLRLPPAIVAAAIAGHPVPDLHLLSTDLASRLGKCTAGSPATCWAIVHFGAMMQLGDASLLEKSIGARIQYDGYERVLSEGVIRDPNQRVAIKMEAQRLKASYTGLVKPQRMLERRLLNSSAIAVQFGCIAFVIAVLGLALWGLLRGTGLLSRFQPGLGIGSSILLGLSTAVVYAAYRPYAELSRFLSSDATVSDIGILFPFTHFWTLQMTIKDSTGSTELRFFLWGAVLLASALSGIGFVFRKSVLRLNSSR